MSEATHMTDQMRAARRVKPGDLRRTRFGKRARLLAALIPAAGLTLGLFTVMNSLITVEEISFDEREDRPLRAITPQEKPVDAVREPRQPPRPIDAAIAPPPPPQYRPGAGAISLPTILLTGAVPELDVSQPIKLPHPIAPMGNRIATPVRQPVPVYPIRMLAGGKEGTCEVRFSLTARGSPYDIAATCTHQGFVKEAERAVSRAEFAPNIVDGHAVEGHGYIWPLAFRIG